MDAVVSQINDARAVVLVEGASDQLALERLAERRGRKLAAEGISIVPIGGATSIGHYLDLLGPHGLDVELAGLCDAGEEGYVQRSLERRLGFNLDRTTMEALGFFVCVADLEEELIRSLGAASVIDVLGVHGEPDRSAPSSSSRRSESGAPRRSSGASWAHAPAEEPLRSPADRCARSQRMPRPLDEILAHV